MALSLFILVISASPSVTLCRCMLQISSSIWKQPNHVFIFPTRLKLLHMRDFILILCYAWCLELCQTWEDEKMFSKSLNLIFGSSCNLLPVPPLTEHSRKSRSKAQCGESHTKVSLPGHQVGWKSRWGRGKEANRNHPTHSLSEPSSPPKSILDDYSFQ